MKKTITAAAIAVVLAAAGCGSSAPGKAAQVKSDLNSFFQDPGENWSDNYSVSFCTHKSANSYVCQVYGSDGKPIYIDVTDDGKSIYEDGVS